jgi:nicotinamidase-related amidase
MRSDTALLLIDPQMTMFDPGDPVDSAEIMLQRMTHLLARVRSARMPVVLIRHCGKAGGPFERGTPGWQLHPSLQPAEGDLVFDKTTRDTFASTALGDELAARGIKQLIIVGFQSEFCVRETTLGALARGFDVTLVSNGHSTCDSGERMAAEISTAVNAELKDRVRLQSAEEVSLP